MKYRSLNLEAHYPILKSYYEESEMKVAPPIDHLPGNGVVAIDKGLVVGALFLVLPSNMDSCIFIYPVMSKLVKLDREGAVVGMYEYAEFYASSIGYKYVHTWSGLLHVQQKLNQMKWSVADKNVNQYMKCLSVRDLSEIT